MPQLLDSSLFSVIDTDSSIGVGWKLNFYIKGTSTRKDTYPTEADASAATNANSNPVVIASDGRLPAIWLADDADYKGILTDENDDVKETIVQINSPRLGGAAGAGNIGFSHANTYAAGTVGNHLKRFVVITDAPYNAVLGDTGNQTAAIQDAIDDVSASGGGDVVIPAGRFRCTGNITVPSNVSIWGSGSASVIHFVNTTGDGLFSAVGTELAPLSKIELRDFTIDGDITFSGGVPSADNGNAIDFQFTDDCRFSGLTISGFSSNGIAVANGNRNEVISCRVDQCAQSIAFYANAIDVEQNRVVSNKVTNNGEYNAIHFEGSAGTGLGDGNLYNSVIVGNVVSDTYGQGINIELAPNSTVAGNTVLRSGPGISADLDNGIFVFGSALCSITGNTVMDCDGYGIVIAAGSNECAVVGNTTADNTQGSMLLTDSSGTAVVTNVTVALNSFNEGDLTRSGNVSTRNMLYGAATVKASQPTLDVHATAATKRNAQIRFRSDVDSEIIRAGVDISTDNGTKIFQVYLDSIAGQLLGVTNAALTGVGDNVQTLGAASQRFSTVYAGTGTIDTSDEREKQQIGSIPDEWLDAWGDVEWRRFKFNEAVAAKSDGARWHVGLIAQQIHAAFDAHGLDAFALGLLCFDEWEETPGLVPEAGDRWGVRMSECLAIEAAWSRREVLRLAARLDGLEA